MWCISDGIGMQTCHNGWQVLKRLNVVAAGLVFPQRVELWSGTVLPESPPTTCQAT